MHLPNCLKGKTKTSTNGSQVTPSALRIIRLQSISWVNMITWWKKKKKNLYASCLSRDRNLTTDVRVAPIITEQTAKLGRFTNYLQNWVSGGLPLLWAAQTQFVPDSKVLCFTTGWACRVKQISHSRPVFRSACLAQSSVRKPTWDGKSKLKGRMRVEAFTACDWIFSAANLAVKPTAGHISTRFCLSGGAVLPLYYGIIQYMAQRWDKSPGLVLLDVGGVHVNEQRGCRSRQCRETDGVSRCCSESGRRILGLFVLPVTWCHCDRCCTRCIPYGQLGSDKEKRISYKTQIVSSFQIKHCCLSKKNELKIRAISVLVKKKGSLIHR